MAGQPRPSRTRLSFQLTRRDVAICQDLTRCYGLTAEQLARRFFGSIETAYHRLGALARAGYLVLQRPWYRGPGVYLVTPAGARLADLGLPAARYKPMSLAHHLAVADLSELLLRAQPGSTWTCERELRRDHMTSVRDRAGGRLLNGVPHVPDGLLVTPSASWAVEVELSKKGDAEYLRILRWYAGVSPYRRVAWFAGAEPVQRRLEELIRRQQLDDMMSVLALPPTVTVQRWV